MLKERRMYRDYAEEGFLQKIQYLQRGDICDDLTSRSSCPSSSRTESLIDGSALPPGHVRPGRARSFYHWPSRKCNRVIHIQPRGWIAAPCRTGLSSTHISDNVCTNME